MRYWLVMPAAGSGSRFGTDGPKQYAPLQGRTVIEWALAPFLADPRCAHIVVALARDDAGWVQVAARLHAAGASTLTAVGGGEQPPTVRAGRRQALDGRAARDWALVMTAPGTCLDAPRRAPADGARRTDWWLLTAADRGEGARARGVQARGHLHPTRIVPRQRHDNMRTARIGEKWRERPFDHGASLERRVLLRSIRAKRLPEPAAGMTSQ